MVNYLLPTLPTLPTTILLLKLVEVFEVELVLITLHEVRYKGFATSESQ